MKHDDLAHYARFPTTESLRLDAVVVRVGDEIFNMNGSLRISKQEFMLDLILREYVASKPRSFLERLRRMWRRCRGRGALLTQELPRIGGFIGASQFWDMTGVIENSIRFQCRTVPISHTLSMADISTKGARFEVNRISLGGDPITHEQTAKLLSRLNTADGKRQLEEGGLDAAVPEKESSSEIGYEFRAVIPGVKPLWKVSFTEMVKKNEYLGETTQIKRDTLTGQASDVEFALIEVDEDMEVHMRYRSGQSVSEDTARARFDALLQAVAFTHGYEPWFQRYEVHRGVQRIEDTVTALQDVPATKYNLLSERACSNGADLVDAIIRAANFFTQNNNISHRVEMLLHIARQAGAAHVPFDLGVLGLCTVFEGIIDALFDEAGLKQSVIENSPNLKAFEKARREVLEELAAKPGDSGYTRLKTVIQGLDVVRKRERAMALCGHFGLDWASVVKPAFDAWTAERNPGAHGAYRRQDDEQAIAGRFRNKSRIAGSINLLMAKRIGYKGLAIRSVLEEEFIRL